MNNLHKIIDETLARMRKTNILMMLPGEIPEEMLDNTIPAMDDWRAWKPIPSIVTDEDLDQFESKIGRKLPSSFRAFLQYKHFGRLSIPDRSVQLFAHFPDHKLERFRHQVHNYDREGLLDRGYIYFANFEDYGYLCFDTNVPRENNEWKVVFIDHEDLDDMHDYAENFQALMEADEEAGNRFIDKLNAYYAAQ